MKFSSLTRLSEMVARRKFEIDGKTAFILGELSTSNPRSLIQVLEPMVSLISVPIELADHYMRISGHSVSMTYVRRWRPHVVNTHT